jgi:hypothetical protein
LYSRCSRKHQTGGKRRKGSHDAPMSEGTALITNRPNPLRMINHGGWTSGFGAKKGFFATLDAIPRLSHGGLMNGFLGICGICRAITS